MEYVVPALMFIFGFGGALLIRRLMARGSFSLRPKELTVDRGAVRLDAMGKKRKRSKRSHHS